MNPTPDGYTDEQWAAMVRCSQSLNFLDGALDPEPAPYRLAEPEHRHDGRFRKRVPNHVYFIRCGDFVKIGVASCVATRLRTIKAMNPRPVEVVHVVVGKQPVEREFHLRFAAYRHLDEWFRIEGELADFLEESRR